MDDMPEQVHALRRAVMDVMVRAEQEAADGGDLATCVRALAGLRQVVVDAAVADETIEAAALLSMPNDGIKRMEGIGTVVVGPERFPRESWNSRPMMRDVIERIIGGIGDTTSPTIDRATTIEVVTERLMAMLPNKSWWRAEGVEAIGLDADDYRFTYPIRRRIFTDTQGV